MARVKIELNFAGLKELWKDPAIAAQCREVAEAVREKLGGGEKDYHVSAYVGKVRAGAAVWVDSYEARKKNLNTNNVLKALGSVVPSDKIAGKRS